jgi:gamma-glutamylputrescine oxidase
VDCCLDTLTRVIEREGIACDLRLPGCLELEHGEGEALWRVGDVGLRVPGRVDGGTLDPGALVEGLARAALRAGARIHEGVPVRSTEQGPPARLRVGDEVLEADHAVVAVNAYMPHVVSLSEAIHPALTLALCTDPMDEGAIEAIGLSGGEPFYTLDLPYLWGRVLSDGRVIFGAGLLFDETGELYRLRLHDPQALEALGQLESRVRGLHPALQRAHATHRWGGPIAFVSGRAPLLGRLPGNPRVIVAGAYAGHGVALGLRAGEIVAEAILRDRPLPAWGALER